MIKQKGGDWIMALLVWLYLALITGLLLIKSIVYQRRVKRYEQQMFAMIEVHTNRMKADMELIRHELKEIKVT